ncbi:unannotated protein [freshwater metagenome]|uniref:Unannotated protein n=1 Tax=freshwater metagenome TaxID=449393 RepID=A0A6J7GKK0_9ZZZZ
MWQQGCPTPAGNQAQENFRKSERSYRGVDGAIGCVESHLESATQGKAIHERKGGHTHVVQPAQSAMALLCEESRDVDRRNRIYLAQICTGGEDKLLTRDRDGINFFLGGPALKQQKLLVELLHGLGAQRIGAPVVEPIVKRQ